MRGVTFENSSCLLCNYGAARAVEISASSDEWSGGCWQWADICKSPAPPDHFIPICFCSSENPTVWISFSRFKEITDQTSFELPFDGVVTYVQRMQRSRTPQRIGDLLGEWVRTMGFAGPFARGMVIAKWEAMMSEQMSQHIERSWMKGDKLFVQVRSAAWRQELHFQREDWRKRLNSELGSDAVKEIVFK